jgi:mannose-6-phosphate isomerase-like protein (cupin superfamily)
MSVEIAKFESLEWTAPKLPPGLPDDLREQGLKVQRRGLASGHGGFHASYVVMPAGQVTVPHSHDHSELVIIQEGSMSFDDGDRTVELVPNDAATISAGQVYGFTVGPAGVSFLLIRSGAAVSSIVGSAGGGSAGAGDGAPAQSPT